MSSDFTGRLPAAFTAAGTSSFTEFLGQYSPELLPGRRTLPSGTVPEVPHGTTIVALTFPGGVVMGGDRRATMGNYIANREIEKVFPADEYSCVGIAGTAGLAVEMVRLFQVELEHYEKIEGALLSLDGKANRLSAMIRGNLGLAIQGLAVVPLFAGYDLDRHEGRIFSFDVTGGRYEEHGHHSVGSGSLFARGSLKKLYRPTHDIREAVRVVVEALYDAADDDSATGGPDMTRRIWPVVATVTEEGYNRWSDEQVGRVVEQVVGEREGDPGGSLLGREQNRAASTGEPDHAVQNQSAQNQTAQNQSAQNQSAQNQSAQNQSAQNQSAQNQTTQGEQTGEQPR